MEHYISRDNTRVRKKVDARGMKVGWVSARPLTAPQL